MNSLRLPIVILVLIVITLGAWYVLAHQDFTSSLPQTTVATDSTASTNSGQASSPQATSTTTNEPSGLGLSEAAVAQNIVGSWQSTDDADYSVVATASGKWTDTYGGSATSSASETGTYELFTSANPDPDFTGVLVPGIVYVKVSEGTSILYFSVLEADGQNLQLSYLDRGNTLSFVKEQ